MSPVVVQKAQSATTLMVPTLSRGNEFTGAFHFSPAVSGSLSGRAVINYSFLLSKVWQRHRAQQDLVWGQLALAVTSRLLKIIGARYRVQGTSQHGWAIRKPT